MYNTIGVIGLGVMGSNIALNMASKGEKVAVYNYTRDLTDQLVAELIVSRSIRITKSRTLFSHWKRQERFF